MRKQVTGRMPVLGGAGVLAILLSLLVLPLMTAGGASAQGEGLDITFEFSPGKAAYAPGETFSVNITAVNTLTGGVLEKITNISIHFSWMAPNEFAWKNVSNVSQWLASDGAGIESFTLPLVVPADAAEQTYSYFFRISYLRHLWYGDVPETWGGTTYHDFVVSTNPSGQLPGDNDFGPYVLGAALGLAIAAIALGMVLYWRGTRRTPIEPQGPEGASAQAASISAAGGTTYPVIRAAPGEHFPIEKGFIYLVKEKRPNISFAMFNEAITHEAKGMLVVREHPNRLKQLYKFDAAKILWLTRRVGVDHIDPTELSLLSLDITKFVQGMDKSVVLLEGLEYIITQNDFETVLRFVNHLHDFVLAHDCAIIIAIDPRVLSTRELALMERSARIVEPAEPMEHKTPEPPAQGAAA